MHMHAKRSEVAPRGGLGSRWSEVAAFTSAIDAALGKWLADVHRIGLTEYRALAHLAQAPDRELRVNDLAQKVGLNQSSATRLVSRLEEKGVAKRDICPDDGRGVYAVLTGQGEALVREVRGPYEERIGELLRDASAEVRHLDVRQLGDALRRIADTITP
ncbi:MarR family transcriptional regulator [Amycolatopsis rhizosphaerae]|uniref:MarR family transcriptional regulator n=1 Tax=Amycolatopsis rhizosphaerae TaxID=2053003 RepID=A0A558CPK8_9PSEU|nr:MarR family transcriptional regulator [Amycolatopsis rhizosphaerae]TVT50703.1 MarR family transcriptional regulator [Amycolatopsis rhizosphaerae]